MSDPLHHLSRRSILRAGASGIGALALANDPLVVELAAAFGARIAGLDADTDGARIDAAFQLALGRAPTDAERERLARHVGKPRDMLTASPPCTTCAFGEHRRGEQHQQADDQPSHRPRVALRQRRQLQCRRAVSIRRAPRR